MVLGDMSAESTVNFEDESEGHYNRLDISYRSKFSTRTFSWLFNGTLCPPTEFVSHFSQPLLLVLAESLRREQELCALLRRKDAEIDDYKHAGATLTRKNLETSVFDEKVWRESSVKKSTFHESIQKSATNLIGSFGQPLTMELYTSVMESWKNPQISNKSTPVTPSKSDSPKKMTKSDSIVKQDEIERREILKKKLEAEAEEKQSKKKMKTKLRL